MHANFLYSTTLLLHSFFCYTKTMGSLIQVSMPQNGISQEGVSALSRAFNRNPNLEVQGSWV